MKFIGFIRKYMAFLVAISISLALVTGYYFPEIKRLEFIIPFLLFFMLYPMMINLRVEDIGKAVKNVKLVIAVILMNFLLTPLLGALWAKFLFSNVDPYLAVGFILKITVPCSAMVAAWTGYANAKVESALIIVALSLVLAIFLVPFWMWSLAGTYVQIDPMMIFENMIFIVILPLIGGLATRKMLVRRYGVKKFKQQIAPYFPAISTCGMLVMVFLIISTKSGLIIENYQSIFWIIVGIATLYPVLFVLAILFSKIAGIDYGNAMALGYGVTAKNHAITIGLATTTFGGTLAVLPAAVAPLIQMPIMFFYLSQSGRIKRFLSSIDPSTTSQLD